MTSLISNNPYVKISDFFNYSISRIVSEFVIKDNKSSIELIGTFWYNALID